MVTETTASFKEVLIIIIIIWQYHQISNDKKFKTDLVLKIGNIQRREHLICNIL